MENTEQTGTTETTSETNGKKTPSPRKEETNGKIGPNGYNRSVENIRHDLDRFEKEHHKLREDIGKTLAMVERILSPAAPGDLTSFVDRGLGPEKEPAGASRDEIARTWESGKRTFEELIAEYDRLRAQKIWSQEDLEGILTRFESLALGIAEKVESLRTILSELNSFPTDKDPKHPAEELIAGLSGRLTDLGERIAESRQAILAGLATRTPGDETGQACSFDPSILSPLLRKIGELEERIGEVRPSSSASVDKSVGRAGCGESPGIRRSLFSKTGPEPAKPGRTSAGLPRSRRLGVVGLMVLLAIVAIVARVKHSGPPPEMTKPVANRETIQPVSPLPKVVAHRPEAAPTPQGLEPVLARLVLAGLDKLQNREDENGQAIADLSGKIERAWATRSVGPDRSSKEKRLIDEGRELEWLVKTWPAGPGRKELLRMMGSYAGE
ncbi:MAG: hypothetical protein ACYDBP_08575 [Leptospirales bacterium]